MLSWRVANKEATEPSVPSGYIEVITFAVATMNYSAVTEYFSYE
jgi:hypothetical protein